MSRTQSAGKTTSKLLVLIMGGFCLRLFHRQFITSDVAGKVLPLVAVLIACPTSFAQFTYDMSFQIFKDDVAQDFDEGDVTVEIINGPHTDMVPSFIGDKLNLYFTVEYPDSPLVEITINSDYATAIGRWTRISGLIETTIAPAQIINDGYGVRVAVATYDVRAYIDPKPHPISEWDMPPANTPGGTAPAWGPSGSVGGVVRLYNGEFTEHVVDLAVPGRGLDFVLARRYLSVSASFADDAVGNNWDHSYHIWVEGPNTFNTDKRIHFGTNRSEEFDFVAGTPPYAYEADRWPVQVRRPANFEELLFEDGTKWTLAGIVAAAPALHFISKIEDRNGNNITFNYDLLQITDTLGRVYQLASEGFFLKSLTELDGLGRKIEYERYSLDFDDIDDDGVRDGNPGDLARVTYYASSSPEAETRTVSYKYSVNANQGPIGSLTKIIDAKGNTVVENVYDTEHTPARVKAQRFQDPRIVKTYTYTDLPETATAIDIGPASTTLTVPRHQTIVKDGEGLVTEFLFDVDNHLICQRRYAGNWGTGEVYVGPEDLGSPTGAPVHGGPSNAFETAYAWNVHDNLTEMRDEGGAHTIFGYESDVDDAPLKRGHVTTTDRYDKNGQNAIASENTYLPTHDTGLHLVEHTTIHEVENGSPIPLTTSFLYDANANVLTRTRPDGKSDIYTYTADGLLATHKTPKTVIDHNGGEGASERTDKFTYDFDEPPYIVTTIQDFGGFDITSIDTFDAAMRLVESKDPKGNVSTYSYTPYDQLEIAMAPSPSPGMPRPTTAYTYDPNNNVTSETVSNFDENGVVTPPIVTQYIYDDNEEKMDRLKQVVRDANGLAATTAYEYDLNGRVTKIFTPEAVSGAQPGNVMHVKYDERDLVYRRGRGNLTNEVPEEFTLFNYDGWGNLLSEVFQAGPAINYAYDAHGRLETMEDRTGALTTYTRNKRGLVTQQIVTSSGNTLETTYTDYDAMGRVENVKVNQDGVGTTFSYTPAGQLWKTEDPEHRITTTTFDTMHRPHETKDGQGNTETYTYDDNSNVIGIARHEENEAGDDEETTASFDYDNLDRQIASTDIADNTTLLAYDSLSRLRKSTDARGNFCLYDYDNLGRQTRAAHYAAGQDPDATQPLAATSQGYDLNGRLVSQTDPKDYTTFYHFDHLDRQDQVRYADGSSVTVLEFDILRRPHIVRNQDGSVATNVYEEEGRLEERTVTAPNGVLAVHEQFQYDGLGRVVFQKAFGSQDDTLATTTEFFFHDTEPEPFITKTISLPDVNISRTITTEYLHTGQPTQKTFTGGGHTLDYSYNSVGQPNGILDGTTPLVATSYVGARRSRQTVGGKVQANYDYVPGASGYRVTGMTHKDANTQATVDARTNTWDDNYNRTGRNVATGAPDELGAHNYSYDALDRMNPPQGETYSLDAAGNRTGGDYQFSGTGKLLHQYSGSPLGDLGYDAAGRLNFVSDSTTYSYKYDALGRLKELVLGKGATVEDMSDFPLNSEQFPPNSWNIDGGTLYADPGVTARIHWPMNDEMRRFSFKYKTGIDPANPDGDENLTNDPDDFDPRYYAQVIVRATRNSSTLEWTFLALVIQPDGLYLREWNEDAVTELGGVAVSITKDQWHDVTIELNGSRVSVRHLLAGANVSQSIEANTTILGGDSVGFGVGELADFEFDDVTTDIPVAAAVALRYHYDAYGRVVGRTLNPGAGNETSQFFIYDNDRIVQELDGSGATVAEWVYGTYIDEPLVMYRGAQTYYYLHDDLYNVIALADNDGDIVERYTYDDFGAPTVWTETSPGTWEKFPNDTDTPVSSVGNPFMFTGRRWDEVLALYDYRTRYYDPSLGRFLRIDTIGPWGDAANFGNPYSYVGNNPWSYTDPYGEGVLTWALAGDYEASDWTAAGVIAEASGLGLKGLFWTGPKNAVVGTVGVVRHPIQTAEGIGNFASAFREDPGAVGTAIWEDIKSIPSDSERIGSIVFDVASSVATAGAVKAAASTGTAAKFLDKIGDVASVAKKSRVIPKGRRPAMASTFGDGLPRNSKTYQTYTKRNPASGKVYTGRTSGTGTPLENIARRDRNHQVNRKGFGPAQLDKSSTNPDAIRGREQQLIKEFGGAQSQGGTSGNQINSISPRNKNRQRYLDAADQEF